jgi:protein tyrosine phosphatase
MSGLFIGDANTAKDGKFFKLHNIRQVINCTPSVNNYYPQVSRYHRIPVGDSSDDENNDIMQKHLIPVINLLVMNPPSDKHGILVHCHAGVSRSATVCAAILRYFVTDSLDDSISYMIHLRPIVFFKGKSINFKNALENVFNEKISY